MSDWDAARYHHVSDPQHEWGLRVLDRLKPESGERILDIGCGTGRLTASILDRAGDADVIGMDRSWTMIGEAKRRCSGRVPVLQADGMALPFTASFDAVFSTAAFHWMPDHSRLFAEISRVLRPGGRLVAQAGGGPNLARLRERSSRLAADPQFAADFAGWTDPWTYAGVDETKQRLAEAGFAQCAVWLEPAPTSFPDAAAYETFVGTVCLRVELGRLAAERQRQYLRRIVEMAAADTPPFVLDYWRLNIDARKL